MALGVKYRLDYSDEQLISWRADILQEGFGGSITAVKMGGTPVMLEMRDIDDPFTPVCHSEATLTLISESLGQYDEFKTADVYEYVLELERDGTLFWQGTLLTEPFTEAFESAPYDVELKFSDGLSELSFERYNVAGTLQSGYTSVIDILVKCFNKLPISRSFREIINLFEDSMDDADTEGLLEQLTISENAFWEIDKDSNEVKGEPCLSVIEGIMYSLKCRIIVSQDIYYIMRISEAKTYPGTVKYVDYDSSGTVTGNGTISLHKSTTGRLAVLPYLLAHLSGATIDINKQYQEVGFSYTSKNTNTINNSLLVNPHFLRGFTTENGSPVPFYYTLSAYIKDVMAITPTALHLRTLSAPSTTTSPFYGNLTILAQTVSVQLVMNNSLLHHTVISSIPEPDLPNGFFETWSTVLTREQYNLTPFLPADHSITYNDLVYDETDRLEISVKGHFDYRYSESYATGQIADGLTYARPMVYFKWKIKVGANYYNLGSETWSTATKSRIWKKWWGHSDTDEILSYYDTNVPRTMRRHFEFSIVTEEFGTSGVGDLLVTWYVPETYRAPVVPDFASPYNAIESMSIVFDSMDVKYITENSTEFSLQKVLGETGSNTLRTRRYESEVKHGDGPSNFSVMSFRNASKFKTSSWSSRGGSESLPGHEWDINQVFENLGAYRIIFNGDLYGLLELHNIIRLVQESKMMLIKGMRFDTKHNIYELKLHEVGVYAPSWVSVSQIGVLAGIGPTVTSDDPGADPINYGHSTFAAHTETTITSNTANFNNTHATHVETNNDNTETAGDFPG